MFLIGAHQQRIRNQPSSNTASKHGRSSEIERVAKRKTKAHRLAK